MFWFRIIESNIAVPGLESILDPAPNSWAPVQ